MKSLYITSVERYSGKTAACLAIGLRLKEDGYRVGYLKPVSLQPYRLATADRIYTVDEDAVFVQEVLGLSASPWELSPVVITSELISEQIKKPSGHDLMLDVQTAYEKAIQGQDILLLEGGGSLREGYVVGLPTPEVAKTLGSKVLAVIQYHDEIRLLDDVLAAQTRLGNLLVGILINRISPEAEPFVQNIARPYIENRGIPVIGVLPDDHGLNAISVSDLIKVLNAEVLTKYQRPQALIENFTVGAMTADAALSRFRKYSNKAVITGGDRTDIQLAALETSTTCLILTGNLRPSALVVKQAEEFGVMVLLVRQNTMETIEAIEAVYGKTRLGEKAKLNQYRSLLNAHMDYSRLKKIIGL